MGFIEEDGDADITDSSGGVGVVTCATGTGIFNGAEVIEDEPILNGNINGISIAILINTVEDQIEG